MPPTTSATSKRVSIRNSLASIGPGGRTGSRGRDGSGDVCDVIGWLAGGGGVVGREGLISGCSSPGTWNCHMEGRRFA